MNKMLTAIASGIIEGLLISSAIFGRNALAFIVATGFFIIQWKHLGKSAHKTRV
jgi:glycerol-3-phosphate dehydrogenase